MQLSIEIFYKVIKIWNYVQVNMQSAKFEIKMHFPNLKIFLMEIFDECEKNANVQREQQIS